MSTQRAACFPHESDRNFTTLVGLQRQAANIVTARGTSAHREQLVRAIGRMASLGVDLSQEKRPPLRISLLDRAMNACGKAAAATSLLAAAAVLGDAEARVLRSGLEDLMTSYATDRSEAVTRHMNDAARAKKRPRRVRRSRKRLVQQVSTAVAAAVVAGAQSAHRVGEAQPPVTSDNLAPLPPPTANDDAHSTPSQLGRRPRLE